MRIALLLFLLVRPAQPAELHAEERIAASTAPVQQAKLRRESTAPNAQLDNLVMEALPTIPELQVGVSAIGSVAQENVDPLALTSALAAAPSVDDVLAGKLGTAAGLSAELHTPEIGLEEMVSELHQQVASQQEAKSRAARHLDVQQSAHAAVDHLAKVITADPDPGLVSQMSKSWLTDVVQEPVYEPEAAAMSHRMQLRTAEVEASGGLEGKRPEMLLGYTDSNDTVVASDQEQMKQQLKEVALHGKLHLEQAKRLESEILPGYRWNSHTNAWEEEPGQGGEGEMTRSRTRMKEQLQSVAPGPLSARDTFEALDSNGDGLLSRQEYFQDADPRRPRTAHDAFEAFDANRDGLISWTEYHEGPSPMAPRAPDYYLKAPDAASDLEALLLLCHRCHEQDDDEAEHANRVRTAAQQLHAKCQEVRSQCLAQRQAALKIGSDANSSAKRNESAADGPVDLAEAQQVADKTLAMEKEILHETGMSDALEANTSVVEDEDEDESKLEVYGSVVLVGGVVLTVAGVALGMELAQNMKSKQQKMTDEDLAAEEASDEQEDWQEDQAEEEEYAEEVGEYADWSQPRQ